MKTLQLPFVFILFFIFSSASSFAQRKEDVLYLSDGSIIRGMICQDSTGSKVRILNHAGDTWSFDRSEIDSMTREKPFEYKAMIFNQPGSEFNISGALLVRSGNNVIGKPVIPSVNVGYGYRFFPFLAAGAEAAVAFYEWTEIPLSAFVRFRTSGRAVAPVFYISSGYTLPAEKHDDDWDYSYTGKGGIHASAGIGIERILNENASLVISFAYHYQELNYHLKPLHQWVQERDRTESYNRMQISLGYVFR